ncbi:hypothetical protein BGZ67_008962 [Mortierella alpina]|nr:hypothetical protein BGZ67_008962 [Mortierella alpina]
MPEQQQHQQTIAEDPNKHRMEEPLVARISNDLGSEHLAGLFEILKDSGGQSALDEDEEMEVDLPSLDETTLVEAYQYVETCSMQPLGSILATEKQRRNTVGDIEGRAASGEEIDLHTTWLVGYLNETRGEI